MAAGSPGPGKAAFTTGSTMRHVVVMTSTASIGLVSIFLVDVINLFYISLLGQQELAAAIGFAATIMFFSVSVCIGISIATAALVGRALGAEDHDKARSLATSSMFFLLILSSLLVLIIYPSLRHFLGLLGATGKTLELALSFLQIVTPSIPLLGLGMSLGALLRAKGDPKRAMLVTVGRCCRSGAGSDFDIRAGSRHYWCGHRNLSGAGDPCHCRIMERCSRPRHAGAVQVKRGDA